ncbi:helix-turn-helix transcriptional regulator [Candidatus Pacearchaeota archaeon]|nr:helix-turn-helix transcriptional regulator [Candidatus Pacearchaeota archaeon]
MIGIGTKLIYLRQKAGLSLPELARKIGMSKAYLWQLEHEDQKSPGSDLLYEISKAFGIKMEWFYETHLFCGRCGRELNNQGRYLTKQLPHLCVSCNDEGVLLLSGQARALREWIEKGKENADD